MEPSELRQDISRIDSEFLCLLEERIQLAEWVQSTRRNINLQYFILPVS